MSGYKYPLIFSVRAKETRGIDPTIAPEIDSDGVFHPTPEEQILYSFSPTVVSFARKRIIEIPEDATSRQRTRLEKKKDRQKWECLGTLKRSTVVVTPLRIIWVCKERGEVWVGFSPKGLAKAALKTVTSAVMATGKWYIGQVVLTMLSTIATCSDDAIILLFSDSEKQYRIDIAQVNHKAAVCAEEVFQHSLRLVRAALEQYAPGQTAEISALQALEASPSPSWHKEEYTGYTVPVSFKLPVISIPTSTSASTTQSPREIASPVSTFTAQIASTPEPVATPTTPVTRSASKALLRPSARVLAGFVASLHLVAGGYGLAVYVLYTSSLEILAAAAYLLFISVFLGILAINGEPHLTSRSVRGSWFKRSKWARLLAPPLVMAFAIGLFLTSLDVVSLTKGVLASSLVCTIAFGVLMGVVFGRLLHRVIKLSRVALGALSLGVLGFGAWQEWGDPWRIAVRWTYRLAEDFAGLSPYIAVVLRIDPRFTFALVIMAFAWGIALQNRG